MFEKHDGLNMSFLSEFYKIRKQTLHFIDKYSHSGISSHGGGRGGWIPFWLLNTQKEVLCLSQVSHGGSSTAQRAK